MWQQSTGSPQFDPMVDQSKIKIDQLKLSHVFLFYIFLKLHYLIVMIS